MTAALRSARRFLNGRRWLALVRRTSAAPIHRQCRLHTESHDAVVVACRAGEGHDLDSQANELRRDWTAKLDGLRASRQMVESRRAEHHSKNCGGSGDGSGGSGSRGGGLAETYDGGGDG